MNILRIMILMFSLMLAGCQNSGVQLPDLTITASGENNSSSDVTFKISAEPTIVSGGMVNATVAANGALTAQSYKNDDINNDEYTITAATTSAWNVECQVRVDNGDFENANTQWTGHLGRDYAAKTLDFYFKCDNKVGLTVKAEHAQTPVSVDLKADKKPVTSHLVVLPPVNLLSSNQFTQQVKLASKTQYQVTVKPMVDARDQVAHFNQKLHFADRHWTVDYEPSAIHLIANLNLTSSGINALPLVINQGYNTVIWHGLRLAQNKLKLTANTKLTLQDRWQQVQAQLHSYSYIQSVLAIDHAGHLTAAQYSALPGLLPTGVQALQLNVSSMPALLVEVIQQWQQQYPRLQVVLNITKALNDGDLMRLKTLLASLSAVPMAHQPRWQGWLQVPLLQLQKMKAVVPAQHLVIAMPIKLSTQSELQYLASYPKENVSGMSLPMNQLEDTLALKSRVFLPESH